MDPAGEFASPYAYVGWDPVNATDPTGACAFCLAFLKAALVLAAVFSVANSIVGIVQASIAGDGGAIAFAVANGIITLAAAAAGVGALEGLTIRSGIDVAQAGLAGAGAGLAGYTLGSTIAGQPVPTAVQVAGYALSVLSLAYAATKGPAADGVSDALVLGKDDSPIVLSDFNDGDPIPEDLIDIIDDVDPSQYGYGGNSDLRPSLEKATLHHGTAQEFQARGNPLAFKRPGTNELVFPEGAPVRIKTLSHEALHVHQWRTIPNASHLYELFGGSQASLINPFEISARNFSVEVTDVYRSYLYAPGN